MKSALELAIEKAEKMEGKKRKGLNADQKEKIAEIRKITDAKIAEAEIMMDSKIAKIAVDKAACELLREDFHREKAKLRENAEEKIENIRERK